MSNLSWEDPPYHNSDAYKELCEKSTPSDFYFDVKADLEVTGGLTMIAIVPKVYFDKHGYMWDQSMFLDHILPEDLSEAMESCWDTERSAEDVRQDLLASGFQENIKFAALVSEDYD
jgi:hypothetical protein